MKKNKRSPLNTLMPLQATAFRAGMKNNNKTSTGLVGPKRKSAPKPIVSNKVIARRVSKNPSVKSYNVSKKQTTSLPTSGGERKKNELSYVQWETGRAKRSTQAGAVPSKFEQKKIKAMNKYQSKVAKKDYSAKRKQAKQAKRAQSMAQKEVIKNIRKTGRPEAPLQNGKELKPIMIKPNMGRIIKPMAKFPDLSGDGKVTKKDILMGRGVIDKPKMKKAKHSLSKDMVAEYAKKGISEKVLNTLGTTKSDTVTVRTPRTRINPRASAALKLSGKSSGNVRLGPLGKNSKEIMTRGEGKKEKIAYAMGDRTYTQDNKNELKNKVNMKKPKMKKPMLKKAKMKKPMLSKKPKMNYKKKK